MKKTLFVVLFTVLLYVPIHSLFVVESGSAEAVEVRDSILFRGVEWGSKVDAVLASFPEGIGWRDMFPDASYSVKDNIYETHDLFFDGHVCGEIRSASISSERFSVAGYPVDLIRLRFAFVPGDDGLLIEDNEHTAFYYAEYVLKTMDVLEAYEDLTGKLSQLYGSEFSEHAVLYSYNELCRVWEDSAGGLLCLYRNYNRNRLEVRYSFLGGNEYLYNATEALILQERMETEGNMDGL